MANPFEGLFDAIEKQDEPHYAAVGRFITSYATAEAAVHLLARKLSGLSEEKARLIFHKMRLGDVMDRVRGMLRMDHAPEQVYAEVDDCLTQLKAISDKRHNLVHRSSGFYGGKLIVSNLLTAKSKASFQTEVFDREEMDAMQSDCLKIYLKLIRIAEPSTGVLDDGVTREILKRPWRYHPKPPQQ